MPFGILDPMAESRSRYDDALGVREARQQYFEDNGFGGGGYDDRWVKLMAGPVPLFFPNTPARVAAVRRHDIHHVLTGYETTWAGEAEIGGWEIASGCGRFTAAWVLNLQALLVGMLIAPGAILRGFAWGRQTGNLYHGDFEDDLLDLGVGELRRRLGLDRPLPQPGMRDRVGLLGWCAVAAPLFALSILSVLAPIGLLVWFAARVLS